VSVPSSADPTVDSANRPLGSGAPSEGGVTPLRGGASSSGFDLRPNPLLEPGLLLRGQVEEVLELLARQIGVVRVSLWKISAAVPELQGQANHGSGASSGALIAAERSAVEASSRSIQPTLLHLSTSAGMQTVLVMPFSEGVAPAVPLALVLVVGVVCQMEAWLPLMRAAADALLVQRQAAVQAAERAMVDRALDHSAATVELFTRSAEAPDLLEAGRIWVEELQTILGSEMAILCRKTWRGLRILAMTGGAGAGRRGEMHDLAEIIAGIAVRESSRVCWGRGFGEGHPLDSAMVREAERVLGAVNGLAEPLVDRAGGVVGAWVFLGSARKQTDSEAVRFLDAVRPHAGAHLALLGASKPGPALGAALRSWREVSRDRRRFIGWAAAIAAGVLLLPVRYPVKARSELEPEFSRTVAVPFDSLLRKARVHAGQSVSAGEVLAEMDGRELRWQLAEALSKKARAAKEAEKAVAEGEIAAARLAELDLASWDEQVRLLEYRRENLQVRAPAGGVVVSGDLDRAEGTPLRTGDPLYEVAVLERMRLRIGVPDLDVALVREGQRVRVRFDSDPGRQWEAIVTRVSPRSEIWENRNVFICEAVLENPKLRLRPGMKGRAVVEGPFRPMVWRWTRRAWNAVRMALW
jgi:multidrug efflux pump subunit AcrA (membrane-fusion protein)